LTGGAINETEYDKMNVPTWNRTLAEFTAPFAHEDLGLALAESELRTLPHQYLAAHRATGDAAPFGGAVSGFLPAFTQPSLCARLDRTEADRIALAARVYGAVRDRARADPDAMETTWHVAVLRIARPA